MDELTAPLGRSRPPRRPFPVPRATAVVLALSLMSICLWVVLAKDLLRDKPMAVAPPPPPQQMQAEVPVAVPRVAADPTVTVRASPDVAARRTITIIDGMSGKRQEVVIGAPEPAPSAAAGQRSR
jgi:hypothetical protein